MNQIKIKTYFNVVDFTGLTDTPWIERDIIGQGWNVFFLNFAKTSWSTDTVLNTLLTEYVWPEYYHSYIAVEANWYDIWNIPSDDSITLSNNVKKEVGGRIYAWLNKSYPVYKKLIDTLEAEKTKLMDDIKTSSTSRFNDTPQNGGDWSDDKHTTNITSTEVTNEVATPIARLAEIEANLKNYYDQWSKEFGQFVIWSAEVE